MTEPLYLSRIRLKKNPAIAPLMETLLPDDPKRAVATDHRLVWSTMPASVQAANTAGRGAARSETLFLWRRDNDRGCYYILGPRPDPAAALFDVETKPFEANLAAGDRLGFVLRVNATVDRRVGGRDGTTMRADIAMDLLKAIPKGQRAENRTALAEQAARVWLERRGEGDGFALQGLVLHSYRAVVIERRGSKPPARIGVFDLTGTLTVIDPVAFLGRIVRGFGRAKAFGCGLMLIRRLQ